MTTLQWLTYLRIFIEFAVQLVQRSNEIFCCQLSSQHSEINDVSEENAEILGTLLPWNDTVKNRYID